MELPLLCFYYALSLSDEIIKISVWEILIKGIIRLLDKNDDRHLDGVLIFQFQTVIGISS